MKKKTAIFLVLFLGLALLGAGCGSANQAYDYDLSEYVELGEYKGLELPKADVNVTDEEVQAEIQNRLKAASTAEVLTEAGIIASGDTANIDFEGKKDGVAFDGGTGTGYDLTIGSGSFIPGFEEGLIGNEIGETVVLPLTFPEEYQSPELAGQAVEFTVKINSITKHHVPPYDLAFVEKNSDSKSLEDYEAKVKEDLAASKTEQAKANRENAAWQQVVDGTQILKYPEKEMTDAKEKIIEYFGAYAEMYQVSVEDFLKNYVQWEGTPDEYYTGEAEKLVGQEMIIQAIARAEDISISDEEYEKGYAELLKSQGYESDDAYKEATGKTLEESAGKESIITALLMEEVMAFLIDSSVAK